MECPRCNSDHRVIMEPPSWRHDTDADVINIECTCINCRISFNLVVSLTNAAILEENIIEENYEYPY